MSTNGEIVRVDPRLHVRKRPGMYVGGIDARAMQHLIDYVVDDVIEEVLLANVDHIWIMLYPDHTVCIQDNGIGFKVDIHPTTGISYLEHILTEPIWGSSSRTYRVSGKFHNIWLPVVNALSAMMRVEVRRDGYLWSQTYREGVPQGSIVRERPLTPDESTGTTFTFTPDFTIFEPNDFNYHELARRSRCLAHLIKRLTITVRDERVTPALESEFHSTEGLIGFVKELNTYQEVLHEPTHAARQIAEGRTGFTFELDFAFQYTKSMNTNGYSYVNMVQTTEGGTHVDALLTGIAKAVTTYVRRHEPDKLKPRSRISTKQIMLGLTFVISVLHPSPSFMSPTKVRLFVPQVFKGTRDFVCEVVLDYLEANPQAAGVIIQQ